MKITFKIERRATGLAAVGHPYPDTQIKADKKECGKIAAPFYDRQEWRIDIAVKRTPTADDPCGFTWVHPAVVFPLDGGEKMARQWILEKLASYLSDHGYELHQFEPDTGA